jgi:uncharacterized protein
MQFEFDPIKSGKNLEKHGIDFEEGQTLWKDAKAACFPAKSESEPRFAIVGKISAKIWVGFFTQRDGVIRIISIRRARKGEKILYEG